MRYFLSQFLILGIVAAPLTAEDETSPASTAKFIVNVNFDAARRSDLGQRLLSMARDAASEEIASATGKEDGIDKVSEALGFNPLEEIRELTILGDDFEEPNLQLILSLGKTTGNLEGMALGLPGYESSEYGKYTIHSGEPTDGKAYAAIHTDSQGMKKIIAAPTRSEVTSMLNQLDAGRNAYLKMPTQIGSEAFIHVRLLEIPTDELGEGPQQNIAKLLQNFSLGIADVEGNFELNVELATETEKQAEQIQQMAQGLLAMVAFIPVEDEDEEVEQLKRILSGLTIKRDEQRVNLKTQIATEDVIEFLREEADLPL